MKMKSLVMLALPTLFAASLANSPVMAAETPADSVSNTNQAVQTPTVADNSGMQNSDNNTQGTDNNNNNSTDNSNNNNSTDNSMNNNSSGNDEASPDTATGDDDY